MHAVDAVTGAGLELLVQLGQQLVVDFVGGAAPAADQVVVLALGDLVDQRSAADVGRQDDALPGQEAQRAVDGGFGDGGQALLEALENLQGGKMVARFLDDTVDGHPLGGGAEAARA